MSLSDERFFLQCPHCNAKYVYNVDKVDAKGNVSCQNCGKPIPAEGQPVIDIPEEPYVPYEKRQEETSIIVAKIYGHGFLFSLLSLIVVILFAFLASFLSFFGGIIGLILSFVLLCGMIGSVNIGLASALWDIKCKTEMKSVFAQGGVIFLILLAMSVIFLPVAFLPYQIVLLLDFLVYPFIYGLVFRNIALQFEIGKNEEYRAVSSGFQKGVCPHCNAEYAYAISSRDSEGNVRCQNCSQIFKLEIRPKLQQGPDID
ncbi:MAG: hypothetical protein EAX87_12540 [Candidatus Thorarchaeota archaeon]|nr:hypothetical protein [Candidatus Thorarchaeota archaeon]